MTDCKRILVKGKHTDVTLGKSKDRPEYLGLYGACGELLYYFCPKDADFFQAISNELRARQ